MHTEPTGQLEESDDDEFETLRDPHSVRLGKDLLRRLAKAAWRMRHTGLRPSDLIRMAVSRFLDELDAKGGLIITLSPDAVHEPVDDVLEAERIRRRNAKRSSKP